MSLAVPSSLAIEGAAFRVGIVAARYNGDLVEALLARATAALQVAGVKRKSITVLRVPGSHEVPWAANELARGRRRYDVVLALGVLIGGDTSHHEMVGASVSAALQRVAVATRVPVINGVIVTDTRAQATARCRGKINRGGEFAMAALEVAALRRRLSR